MQGGIETIGHTLWFYKHAMDVWKCSKLALPFEISATWKFLDVVEGLLRCEHLRPRLGRTIHRHLLGDLEKQERSMDGRQRKGWSVHPEKCLTAGGGISGRKQTKNRALARTSRLGLMESSKSRALQS